jgi:hypothetical protein
MQRSQTRTLADVQPPPAITAAFCVELQLLNDGDNNGPSSSVGSIAKEEFLTQMKKDARKTRR